MSLVSAWRQLLMLIAGCAQEVSSRRKDRRNRTHVDHSLTCCSEENVKPCLFVGCFVKALPTEQERVGKLLELLRRQDSVKFPSFCEALIATGQRHVVDSLLADVEHSSTSLSGILSNRCFLLLYYISLIFMWLTCFVPSVFWRCWLGGRKGTRPVENWVVGCWCG